MKTPRYCPPAVMLKDNFIVVAGGQIHASQRQKYTNTAEIYDIHSGVWMPLSSLNKARG
jgi:hypothetical protein